MCKDRSDDETAGLPFQWDDEYDGGLSPPASTVLNSSFSYTGAHHGHSNNNDVERMLDGDEDAEGPNMREMDSVPNRLTTRRKAEVSAGCTNGHSEY